ncbi:MAG: 50S ribosomal protein L24 [Alphaproteobacteria bacterium]|nr:50S ribosomal protein L24 [Alphaproteobacteria bacterium]MDP3532795.1 50S ribosomal protein L24 [Alphaproteobacteria bacterium]
MKIKRGDDVVVIAGKDKGKTGKVREVFPKESRVKVEGINIVKKHKKPTQLDAGGIVDKELSIHVSNVAHIDPESQKPTRIGYKLVDGKKSRFAKASGSLIDR